MTCSHLSQPAVSHHLALLRVDGLIDCRRDGKHNFYRLLPDRFSELMHTVFSAVPGRRTASAVGGLRADVPVRAVSRRSVMAKCSHGQLPVAAADRRATRQEPRAMSEFVHERHKPPFVLPATCELLVACPPLRSQVNLSRIVRAASCCGVRRIIACGRPKLDRKITRDGADCVTLECHRVAAPGAEASA